MALWNVNGEIVFAEGALKVSNPTSPMFVKRHVYTVPYTNVGKGGFIMKDGEKFHVPSWTKVHLETTVNDIEVEEKPFAELFIEPKSWTYESSTGDKTYTVRQKKDGSLYCDCWGYIAHKKCKHIKQAQSTC